MRRGARPPDLDGLTAAQYSALATDYDGTLAQDGVVDEPTIEALRRAGNAGLELVMVTGRHLDDLLAIFPHTALFDMAVVENGALLYSPRSGEQRLLAAPPPPEFLRALARAGVPFSVGRSVVATTHPHEDAVTSAIRDLGLDWHAVLNKGSVMALPSGTDKGTGTAAALDVLGIPPSLAAAIGDAENDVPLLRLCGLAVAVANALPEVLAHAHLVTDGAHGTGVIELINSLLATSSGKRGQPPF